MTETTRQLYLMRHAHAARPAALSDKARPLDERGVEQAGEIGRQLAGEGIERIWASAAIRTQQTAARLALSVAVEPVEAFYYGDSDTMLDRLRTLDDAWTRVLLVGHNPSIAYLAHDLADPSQSDPGALALIASQFPTATCCRLDFEGRWRDLSRCRLVHTWRA